MISIEKWDEPTSNNMWREGHVLEKTLASSVGTARRCFKSDLFPTSMMTMFESAWSRSSLSHRVTFT